MPSNLRRNPYLPLLATIVFFLFIVALQIWNLTSNRPVEYALMGWLFLLLGAFAVSLQVMLLLKRPRR